MRVQMDDGTTFEIHARDVFDIPSGHDAEVIGNKSCVQLNFSGFGDYAKPAQPPREGVVPGEWGVGQAIVPGA